MDYTVKENHKLYQALKQHADILSVSQLSGMNFHDGYATEFEEIERATYIDYETRDRTSARTPENKRKNRHSNVLPYEDSRVVLRDGGPDYINANYIRREGSNEVVYIAAQGPNEITVIDFWRMVWQEKTNVIVMLTKIVEDRREKCHRYYPMSKSPIKEIPPFRIKLLDKESKHNGALVKRRMELTHLELNESQEITHFQYKEWPDHEPPANALVFTDLLQAVNTVHNKEKPLTVHCSAGIGRTGTFCAVHSVLNNINGSADPAHLIQNTVLQLRNGRPGMVQTKDQYKFCYRSILEGLVQENNN